MTQNQIAFAKLSEEKRHNIVSEGETGRHNLADESIRYSANAIQRAMNDLTGQHYQRMDLETQRHDKASERISNKQIAENRRHSKESEHISRYQSKEQKRHNIATENLDWYNASTNRMNAGSNAQQAAASMRSAEAANKNAYANMFNAQTRQEELDLSRDKYSLDQWATTQTTAKQLDKVQSEIDLNKSKKEYQDKQNEYYLVNKVDDVINGLGPISAAGDVPKSTQSKSKKVKSRKK